MGQVVVAVAMAVLCAVFVVLACSFRRGKWLNLIAGNNFVTKEEMGSPDQRKLGKQVGILMFLGAAGCAACAFMSVGGMIESEPVRIAGTVLSVIAWLSLVAGCVLLVVRSVCSQRESQRELLAHDPSQAEGVGLERRQTKAVLGIIGALVVVYLVIGAFAVLGGANG